MKNKGLKIFFASLCSAILLAIFIALCVCAYKFKWNMHAFWWPWAGALFILDVVCALTIFHNKNKSDETKAFWLFIIVSTPFIGYFFYCFLGRRNNVKDGTHKNNAKLLEGIFEAEHSITICASSFYAPYDTLDALKYVSNSNKEITLIVTKPKKKLMNELLHQLFERKLSRNIKIYFTENDICDSFFIIDDKKVIIAQKNFNYKNVICDTPLAISTDAKRYSEIAKIYLKCAEFESCEPVKRPPYKRILLALIKIFYIIL